MRTTLDIDDDLLAAAKELARAQRKSAGRVVSDMMRKALNTPGDPTPEGEQCEVNEPESFYGFRPFPARGRVVTNELINKLRDETHDL